MWPKTKQEVYRTIRLISLINNVFVSWFNLHRPSFYADSLMEILIALENGNNSKIIILITIFPYVFFSWHEENKLRLKKKKNTNN